MDIKELAKGAYQHDNPQYNPKTKKGRTQPQFLYNADPNGANNRGSVIADIISDSTVGKRNLDYLGSPEKYAEYDVTISPVDASLEKELANEQGALHKFGNAIAQAAVSEVVLGTAKGISDLVDFVSGAVFRGDNDYSNPVSQYLGQLQEDFKNYAPIYSDPDKNIFNGGLVDAGWWASNLPSVMSSLTLMIPSTGITKALGWAGRALNTASKGKLGAFGRNTYKAITGASKAKTVEEAEKLNKVTRWLNDTNTMAAGQRMAETGFNAALMRTMENYQEANQVYNDMKTQALDKFNTMTDEEYAAFVQQNANTLGDVDINDKEAVANKLAKQSADRTFLMDYVNTIFDVIQLNALRNPIKLLKNMRSNAAIEEAQRASMSAIGKGAIASTEAAAEKAGLATTAKNFGKGASRFLKDSAHEIKAELSEGVEEAVNYIAQEEGMHYGNVALGEDIENGFTSRLGSYMRSPELYDAAFWGVLGGVVFQGLGSGFNRLSVAAERAYQQKKKSANDKTKEGINLSNFQELFETSENKRRIADIEARSKDFNDLVTRLKQIEEQSIDPFNVDENRNPISLETETEKTIARERAISEYITGMTFRAMDNGNFDMLKAYLQDSNIRQALEEATGNEGDGGAFINSVVARMDHIADRYSQNLIALSNISRNINIASESAIPLEYLQIIARDNTATQIKLEDINARIGTYETSAANKVATYGNKLDQSLNYKDAVQLVVLTQQLAQLRAKKAEIEKDKSKQGIGRQIELDRINKNIDIVQNMIKGSEETSNSDALTKLLYSTIQADLINDKDAYVADIDSVFEGQYGLNKIDKRLGDDYIALAGLNIEKAVLNEQLVMNESNLSKKVNELHNDMLDARKKAIEQAGATIRSLAKTYGRDKMASHLETGAEITWQNDTDKKQFDDALEVLNLTSASNQQLYDDIQGMLMMDELIDRSQEAADTTGATQGESSSTSQNQNIEGQTQKVDNKSAQSGETATAQGNTLNPAESGQGKQPQGQTATPASGATPSGTTTSTETSRQVSTPSSKKVTPVRTAIDKLFDSVSKAGINVSKSIKDSFNRTDKENLINKLENINYTGDVTQLNKDVEAIFNSVGLGSYWANRDAYDDLGITGSDISNAIFEVAKASTNSSTGGQNANKKFDDNGQPVPDANREAIKTEIGREIVTAIKQAKASGTDATEAINAKVQELNNKYGQDEEFKKEINKMATSWHKRAKAQGLAKDVVDLVLLASSVTEQGGKYNFPQDYLNAARKFAEDFLKAANAKEFNGKKVVSFESILRFANAQMEDPTTAEYIYKSLKAWFEAGPNKNDYIILDNMDSTSILERAGKTDRQLANERLGGTDVFRVQIDQFLTRNASKAAIDKIQKGDTLNAKVDNGDIILMVGDVEVGRLPQPEIDSSTGGFKKTNNGWITDVSLSNGNVVSKLRKVWEDILTNKSTINDKINDYIYKIIAANKINGDTKAIKDAIEKDSDLQSYFDGLKQQGIIDKKANSVELIDGLVSVWNYIDLTNPDPNERSADINYSLDLWFNKLYDSYSTIANATVVGVDKLTFKVAKITDGDVIQVAPNDNEGYDKCTLGTENEAFANVDTTEVGVIKPGSIGVIQTTDNESVSQPNGSTGSMWAVLPNRSGIPGIVRGHALRFMDTDNAVNNTAAGRIRQAVENEFERRIRNWASDINNENAYKELAQFIDLVFGNNTSTPIFAPVYGGQNGKFRVDNTREDRIVISYVDSAGNWSNFTINFLNMQYNNEKLGYKNADNVESFIRDFRDNILVSSMFNADFRFFDSDSGAATINGLATRKYNSDGSVADFVITIPNGTDNPTVETFPSFKHFLMQGGAARWNTKNENGSNFQPRSNNQLRNQVLNVSIENKSSLPVEGNVDKSITPETINNGTAIDTLLEKRFGKDSPAVKRLQQAGLIPSQLTYTTETLDKGGHPSNIWTSISQKKIYVNDEFIKIMEDNPDMAIRKLIHEQLHLKLHGKGNRRKELLNRIQEIYNDFEKSLGREGVDEHLKEYLFNHIDNSQERLEEFLVESLTNRELASYLNTVDATAADTKTKKSIFDKILELLADIFDWKITEGSLYEKELKVLQGYAAEEIKELNKYNPYNESISLGEITADFDSADANGAGAMIPIKKDGKIIGSIALNAYYRARDRFEPWGKDKDKYVSMSSVGDAVEIDEDQRGKGYGKAAYFEMAKLAAREGLTLVSAPDGSRTEAATRVWESLVRDGFASKVGNRYEFFNENLREYIDNEDEIQEEKELFENLNKPDEETSEDDDFDEEDYDGMAASVNEVSDTPISKEMQEIKERAIADGTFMKAPNGNPTNLTERQWLQVRTQNFKDWFGDWENNPANASKVVDENGEPLVVYHGTKNTFTEFSKDKRGEFTQASSATMAFFAASNRLLSERYYADWKGKQKEVESAFLKRRDELDAQYKDIIEEARKLQRFKETHVNKETLYNAFPSEPDLYEVFPTANISLEDIRKFDAGETITIKEKLPTSVYDLDTPRAAEYIAKLSALKSQWPSIETELENSYGIYVKALFLNIRNPRMDSDNNNRYREDSYANRIQKAISNRNDGGVIKETHDPIETDVYYFFEPSQAKSATDNIGTFSTENDDIYASSVQESTTPTLNQFVESLPLEERVEFNKLLLDGTISMKCS